MMAENITNGLLRSGPTDERSPGSSAATDRDTSTAATLMGQAALGDRAFEQLYEHISPRVWGTVLQVVRDRAIAEEVAQEVLVEVWCKAPRFDASSGSVMAWVTTIAHSRAVDRVRSEQSARDRNDREGGQSPIAAPAADEALTEKTDSELNRDRVRKALDRLSDVQRQAVELAFFGGNTYREVAVLLDTPEGTIKTRIRDGLSRLRHELEAS